MDPVKFRVDTFLSFLLYYFVSDNCKHFHTLAGSHCGGGGGWGGGGSGVGGFR